MFVQTYIYGEGRSDEMLEFYKKAVGAEVTGLMRFKDAPDQSNMSPGSKDKVMHAHFKVGDTGIMISDGRNQGNPKFDGFALTVQAKDAAEAEKYFKALSEGGQVTMPLTATFFAHSFGMLADKFGLNWMVIAAKPM
jgi:PhnB protein